MKNRVKYRLTKRPLALLLALCLTVTLLPVSAMAATEATDFNGHWAANAIETCHTYSIMNGDGNGTYAPNADITRAEFAALVNRTFGYDALSVPELTGYTDLPTSKWYAGDMQTAIALGIITGYGDGIAAPEDKITREQAVVILCKILRLTIVADTQTRFTDIGTASDWAVGSILTMERHGYIAGYNNQFNPTRDLTRAEAAQMLANVFGVIVDGELDAQGKTYQNVTLRKPGAVLKNAVIKGDLFITEGVGDGDVWLDNVKISGRLLAAGGGENSIHVKDITVGDNVVVDKPSVAGEEPVRFRAIQSNDNTIVFEGAAREVIITDDIIIIIDVGGEKTVFNIFKSEGTKPSVEIRGGAEIEKITAFVPTDITGGGDVGMVEAHTDGVEISSDVNVKPEDVEAEKGVEVKVGEETKTGEGIKDPTPKPSDPATPPTATPTPEPTPAPTPAPTTPPSTGGGTSTVSVTGVTLNKSTTTILIGASETLTATVAPSNAANKNVTWESSNTAIATVSDGVVTPVGAGTATITVKTNDGNKTATCAVTVLTTPGTAGNPFLVENLTDLQHVGNPTSDGSKYDAWTLSAHYKQTTDIDLSSAGNWTPIGTFTGTYDGDGNEISDLTMNPASDNYYGLFYGVGTGGAIENIVLSDVSISGGASYVGAVAGYSYGTISDCTVGGSVGGKDGIGGIVGYNIGAVTGCTVTASVNGTATQSNWIGGIVGYSSGGTITDCHFSGNLSTVSGGDRHGGIVGLIFGGTISGCTVEGSIVGGTNSVGGIAGQSTDYGADKAATIIENCYVSAAVSGGGNVGGIVGMNEANGTVRNCYSTGNASKEKSLGSSWVGGLVGNNAGLVEKCYTLSVVGKGLPGGLVGINGTTGILQNCVALNSEIVSATGSGSGRVASGNNGTLINNYAWNGMTITATGVNSYVSDIGTDKVDGADIAAAQVKTQAAWTAVGFIFDATNWKWTDGKMPHLFVNDAQPWPGYLVDAPTGSPDGTAGNPFLVTDETDLRKVGTGAAHTGGNWTLSAHYKQTANIPDMSGTAFTAIGNTTTRFTGSYDGDGKTINGLTINASSNDQGLFGVIGNGGTVKNLGLVNVSITGQNYVGGVAGVNNGMVQNCYVTGSVTGISSSTGNVGGVVGTNSGTVENCYVTASVKGYMDVGGVVGYNYTGATVQNCVALNPSVTATGNTEQVGRVVGGNSSGTLTGNYEWGGMKLYKNTSAEITPTATTTGGKDGADLSAATMKTNAFWTTATNWNTTSPAFAWDFTETGTWIWTADKMPHLNANDLWDWPGYLVDPSAVTVDNGTAVTGYDTLATALNAITVAGTYTVSVHQDLTEGTIAFNKPGVSVTLLGDGAERTIQFSGSSGSQLLTISNGSLTLGENITLKGISSTAPLVSITGGTLNMVTGSKITGHTITSGTAGTVQINSASAVFNMSGGEITGNISQNSGGSAVGGVTGSSGTFNMSGGRITGNTSAYEATGGSEGYTLSADVYLSYNGICTFTLSGTAEIGTLTLGYSNPNNTFSKIILGGSFTGSIAGLSLYSSGSSSDAETNWQGTIVLQADAGHALTQADADKFNAALLDFRGNTQNTYKAISGTLIIDSTGKLVAATSPAMASLDLAAVTANVIGGMVSITGTEDGYTFVGEIVTVTATPDDGWTFSHWENENGEMVGCDDLGVPSADDPRKEPDPVEAPDDNDEEDTGPDGDGGTPDDDGTDGQTEGDGDRQLTPQQAIATLNSLLAYCGTVTGR